MNKEQIIDFLLRNAGDSIKYRLHREVLGTPAKDIEMSRLQARILEQRRVKKIFSYQYPDGWIGSNIHGCIGTGLDCSVETLRTYGVEATYIGLQRAKHALLNPGPNEPYKRNFPGGDLLDRDNHGGVKFFKALILAQLEAEDEPLVQEQISLALKCFRDVRRVNHLDEVSVRKPIRNYDNSRYFIEGKTFPGYPHYAILSHTKSWRNPQSTKTLSKAVEHTLDLEPQKFAFFVKEKSRAIGLTGCWEHLVPDCGFDLPGVGFILWLRELERFCRLGIAKRVKKISSQVAMIKEFVSKPNFIARLSEDQLSRIKQYSRLEVSWRKEERILCDIYFKFLMIWQNGTSYADN
jgi:hypothetical protein